MSLRRVPRLPLIVLNVQEEFIGTYTKSVRPYASPSRRNRRYVFSIVDENLCQQLFPTHFVFDRFCPCHVEAHHFFSQESHAMVDRLRWTPLLYSRFLSPLTVTSKMSHELVDAED